MRELSGKELALVTEVLDKVKDVEEFSSKIFDYYFKVYPSNGMFIQVKFVCEELGIDVDVTDYESV